MRVAGFDETVASRAFRGGRELSGAYRGDGGVRYARGRARRLGRLLVAGQAPGETETKFAARASGRPAEAATRVEGPLRGGCRVANAVDDTGLAVRGASSRGVADAIEAALRRAAGGCRNCRELPGGSESTCERRPEALGAG